MTEPDANPAPADLLYGAPAIAEFLGLPKRQVYHLIATDTIPTFKVRAKVCARRSRLRAWLDDQEASNG